MDEPTKRDRGGPATRRSGWAILLALAAASGSGCGDATPRGEYAWLELGAGGERLARAITSAPACPEIEVDGRTAAMRVRAAASPPSFPVTACEATIPADARAAAIGGQALPLPREEVRRLAVIGDTGCRIEEGHIIQACNDPDAWPFAGLAHAVAELVAWITGEPGPGDFTSLARSIAELDPDVIVHVGDYLYRESPCPEGDAGCEGSPSGYNWETIEADFFAPAAPLFRTAPLVLTRGNHESCSRAGNVWFRFLDTRPYDGACSDYTDPFSIETGGLQFLMLDSSAASDTSVSPEQVARYRPQFAELHRLAGPRAFLVTHRPIWAFGHAGVQNGQEVLFRDNPTLQAASGDDLPASVEAVLSGHIHLFEVLGFTTPRPPQIVVGNSGTELDPAVTTPLPGLEIAGATVADGATLDAFGFVTLEMRDDAWLMTMRDMSGQPLGACTLDGIEVSCP